MVVGSSLAADWARTGTGTAAAGVAAAGAAATWLFLPLLLADVVVAPAPSTVAENERGGIVSNGHNISGLIVGVPWSDDAGDRQALRTHINKVPSKAHSNLAICILEWCHHGGCVVHAYAWWYYRNHNMKTPGGGKHSHAIRREEPSLTYFQFVVSLLLARLFGHRSLQVGPIDNRFLL